MEIKEITRKIIVLSKEEKDAFEKITNMLSDLCWEMHSLDSDIKIGNSNFTKDEICNMVSDLCILGSDEIEFREKGV